MADVRAYDRIHVQILHMADMLSDGLLRAVSEPFPLVPGAAVSQIRPEATMCPSGWMDSLKR